MTVSIETARAAYADINAERSRQLGLQQNGGRELEPLERGSLLQVFEEECAIWYEWRQDPCVRARCAVYSALLDRHGEEAVMRWQPQINVVLNRTEDRAGG